MKTNLQKLLALAILGGLLESGAKAASAATEVPAAAAATAAAGQQAANGPELEELNGLLSQLFANPLTSIGAGGAACVGSVTTEIPQDIAEAAGMNAPDFDITSPAGQLIGLLAAAQAQSLELAKADPTDQALIRFRHASRAIGAAIGILAQ